MNETFRAKFSELLKGHEILSHNDLILSNGLRCNRVVKIFRPVDLNDQYFYDKNILRWKRFIRLKLIFHNQKLDDC